MHLTAAIPTYGRDQVLLDTLNALLGLAVPPDEILVLDQTQAHTAEVAVALQKMHDTGQIRWRKIAHPSITQAMNLGLLEAKHELILFLDDDIIPESNLIKAHLSAHAEYPGVLVAGRVLQPWQEGVDFSADSQFHFASLRSAWIQEFMGGNFSVPRDKALALGGFDENFVRVAYRFEAEFAHRWCQAGERIYFTPDACIHHLKVAAGGTRNYGEHLTTFKPDHAVGAYYYALRTLPGLRTSVAFLKTFWQGVATRYHLRHPWWIPGTCMAHLRAMIWALILAWKGPRYVQTAHVRKENPWLKS